VTTNFYCTVVKDFTQFGAEKYIFGTNLVQVPILVHTFGTSLAQLAPFFWIWHYFEHYWHHFWKSLAQL